MTTIILGATGLLILIGICYVWANSIDYMNKHHSDYKGEDLFDEEKEEDK